MKDAGAVNAVAELAQRAAKAEVLATDADGAPALVAINGGLEDPRKPEPTFTTLALSTLTGLVDYIEEQRDDLQLDKALIHVESPTSVAFFGSVFGRFRQREVYARVSCPSRMTMRFGTFDTLEAMVIALRMQFEPGGDRDAIVQLLGNVTAGAEVKRQDDGFTQKVTARNGISLVDNVEVPNPVTLAPRRTFAQVDQPLSPFVLRLREQHDEVTAALFEADGGAWQIEAVENVASFLEDALAARGITIPVIS